MSSGIPVNDECVRKYEGLKTGRLYKYVIFEMSSDYKEIVAGHRYRLRKPVEGNQSDMDIAEGDNESNTANLVPGEQPQTEEEMYEEFLKHLPPNECRYAVYDMPATKNGVTNNKLVFISWSPDDSKIKPKMVYSSSKNDLVRKLEGIYHLVQATDADEISFASIESKLQRI
ncbi:cofilin [Coemansia sp. Benny D115]|nr:cofilin [Coemansia sp. Benny D115]